ncbi:casein kinase II beta subunit [Rozella allomycis CSF55]|uniref:Casein kinase II subunit beta n=1 Tax=Rozella allomycis (strain CSF55) TaxID=988480 RepID=A0A075ANU7_ROZAC|nr:Casein kinase II, regulatory subunit, alpha-helical domain-containing protein [Rozella allomycis CSF55]RKP19834.1 casein kinase II beta subunit [Rozella allomycis CSF55]|eukprot:EPZ31625.1 Casein kinase II, regulatory subunit, alpha-helical domain-containing protein [Rozella allomycis CSF55]
MTREIIIILLFYSLRCVPIVSNADSAIMQTEYFSSTSDSDSCDIGWVNSFLNHKGNEYYCEVDQEYILDKFNLAGLPSEVKDFEKAYEIIIDEAENEELYYSACHLYGLIHSRYIISPKGLSKMQSKFKQATFGKCQRTLCQEFPLLPVGISDAPGMAHVYLYCAKCNDVYSPSHTIYKSIDGCHFGRTFPHFFFLTFPNLFPLEKPMTYKPRMFGFKLNGLE